MNWLSDHFSWLFPPPPPPPAPPPPPPPPELPPPPAVDLYDVLNERQGWGSETIGGYGGDVVTVNTLASSGPGSLADYLLSTNRLWITFSPGLAGTIRLASIMPSSFKTIDGRGAQINLRGPTGGQNGTSSGAPLYFGNNTENFILLNLTLNDGWTNYGTDSEGADALNARDCRYIWVHQCTFGQWTDGAFDHKGNTMYTTISKCKTEKIYQAWNFEGDRVTFCYNWSRGVKARNIQMLTGKGHSYNNVIENWGKEQIQNAKNNAQILSEYNLWVPSGYNMVNGRSNGGRIRNEHHYVTKSVTFLGGNDSLDATFVSQSRARAKITKPTTSGEWSALRTKIQNESGAK